LPVPDAFGANHAIPAGALPVGRAKGIGFALHIPRIEDVKSPSEKACLVLARESIASALFREHEARSGLEAQGIRRWCSFNVARDSFGPPAVRADPAGVCPAGGRADPSGWPGRWSSPSP